MSEECVHGYLQQWCLICDSSKQTSLTKQIKPMVKTVFVEPTAYCVDLEEDALIEASKILGLEPTDVKFLQMPLYTHPATEDYSLTNEKIHELANKHLQTQDQDGKKVVVGLEDFAREILKNARKK